jgi:thymidylate synthase
VEYLETKYGVTIWDEWADDDGNLGPVYGAQWRSAGAETLGGPGIDQIADVMHTLEHNPNSRRHLVSAWNVAELPYMALPPCHFAFQFNVTEGKLNCLVSMRSVDLFLGLPFNIASYALLTMMAAKQLKLELGVLTMSLGDTHIYLNHIEQMKLQLTREPFPLPIMELGYARDIFDYAPEDFTLRGYTSHPAIKGDISV